MSPTQAPLCAWVLSAGRCTGQVVVLCHFVNGKSRTPTPRVRAIVASSQFEKPHRPHQCESGDGQHQEKRQSNYDEVEGEGAGREEQCEDPAAHQHKREYGHRNHSPRFSSRDRSQTASDRPRGWVMPARRYPLSARTGARSATFAHRRFSLPRFAVTAYQEPSIRQDVTRCGRDVDWLDGQSSGR